jgi:hypothetical protein
VEEEVFPLARINEPEPFVQYLFDHAFRHLSPVDLNCVRDEFPGESAQGTSFHHHSLYPNAIGGARYSSMMTLF